MSQDENVEGLVNDIWNFKSDLNKLWDVVSLDVKSRENRTSHVCRNVVELFSNIIVSEKQMVDGVLYDITERRKEVAEMRQLFLMPKFDERIYESNSIALLKALDKDALALRQRKRTILDTQTSIYNDYKSVCRKMAISYEHVDGICDEIVCDTLLEELRTKTNDLKETLKDRLQQVAAYQAECKKIHKVLSHHCQINADEIALLSSDFESANFVLSAKVVERLAILEEKLKDQYDEWVQHVAFRYDELIVKIMGLSEKCFNATLAPKYPINFDPEELGERGIEQLEADLKLLEEKYERGKPVFDKLKEWTSLWQEKLDADRRVCRASFYKNRGGVLSTSLKRQKVVSQQLPKVFEELRHVVSEYVLNFSAEDILIDGMMPDKYAEIQQEEYKHDKEAEKAQKQFLKKGSNGKENGGQAKPNINQQTFLGRSAFKASQYELVSPAVSVARSGASSRKRSFSCSQLSTISPTKPPLSSHEPLTSSPKLYPPSKSIISRNNIVMAGRTPTAKRAVTPVAQRPVTPLAKRPITPLAKRPITPTKKATDERKTARPITPNRPWY